MTTPQGHVSVLAEEAIANLRPSSGRVFFDGTLGAGGHTAQILAASNPDGTVIAVDKDPAAIRLAEENVGSAWTRVHPVQGSFASLPSIVAELGYQTVDGILLDLGVSSMQLDQAARGFSFARPGPIDMRMNPEAGQTALDLVRTSSEPELSRIIDRYGEERYHRRVARALKEASSQDRLVDTVALADVISEAIPAGARHRMKIHPATKTFQALRIAVNRELDDLEKFLREFPAFLSEGGRCVIISFHSLEDRLVKHRFRELAWTSSLPAKYAALAGERVHPVCTVVTKKPVYADPEEIAVNPRARSARLRACEKQSGE